MPVSQKAHSSSPVQARFAGRVLFKSLVLFLIINLMFGLVDPIPFLGQLSVYNHLFPGRQRLPYGDNPSRAYNLSLFQLDAMFASHLLAAGPKPDDEFRVILIGDSSTWGYLLHPDQTISAHLNGAALETPDGRTVRVYNLGYPVMSLMKDLLILSLAGQYQPDLVVWPLTLESLPYDKQLFAPLLQHNPQPVRSLIQNYQLNLNSNDPGFVTPGFWDRTLLGQRRTLADLLRLQLYGVLWAATGIDQDIPENYTPRMEDLPADLSFHHLQPPHLEQDDLAFEILQAGIQSAGQVPVIIINEPIFISQGENSDIRYNFYYPRWAYDDYRKLLAERSVQEGWHYLDLWNVIDGDEFTNSAVHLSPAGSSELAGLIAEAIVEGPWATP
jgi:hypothetical protein